MAVAYQTQATTDITSATQSPVVSAPSGVADGDLLLMFVVTNGNTNVSGVAGWTLAGAESDNSTDSTTALLYKVASSEGASWTMTSMLGSQQFGRFVVLRYSGADGTSPINAVGQTYQNGGTTVTSPSITPSVNDCMIVMCHGSDPGTNAYAGTPDTSPAATERFDGKDGNSYAYAYVQEYLQGTAAAVTLEVSMGSTQDHWGIHIVAIKPAAGAGGISIPVVMHHRKMEGMS